MEATSCLGDRFLEREPGAVAALDFMARAFFAAVESPKHELWLEPHGQIDFYDDPKLVIPAADAVAAFLRFDALT